MAGTLYPRNLTLDKMPYGRDAQGKSGRSMSCADEINLKRSKKFSFLNLRPILGFKHPKTWATMVRFILMFRLRNCDFESSLVREAERLAWFVRLAKKNKNARVAEMRTWTMYPALLVAAVGLSLWGVRIERETHRTVEQVGFLCKDHEYPISLVGK
uniref:Uncharacterized protein n=1 Tax=Coccidioides posadasii RMSCC 3488 TaxID=454284 RepID=A0A0J6FCK8_COCPO|nr:hypothetical protein CPAG_02972 [Coccidioides posadasii RMSCC 3488]